MLNQLTRNWWLYAVRGVIAILFGIAALIWPVQMKHILVALFGAFAVADGIFALIAGFTLNPFFDRWWAVLFEGVVGILIGCVAFIWPNVTARILLYFVAIWAIVTGIFEIVAAVEFRRLIKGEWLLILSGVPSIVFGVLLFVFPKAGLVSLVLLIGIYAIAFGIALVVGSFRMHHLQNELKPAIQAGL